MTSKIMQVIGLNTVQGAQPDWNQTDETKNDFIKNKPTLGALAAKSEVAKEDLTLEMQESIDSISQKSQVQIIRWEADD